VLGLDRDTCGRCRRGLIGAALLGGLLVLLLAAQGGPARAESYGDAMDWYGSAAQAGDAEAQYLLAYALETGVQGDADPVAARDWYRAAAGQGHPRAALRLALMMLEGRGGPVDTGGAAAVLEPAAEAGESDAMSLLGWLLASSGGDRILAYRWLTLAAEAGDGAAAANLATLMNAMSGDRLAAAEAALQDWCAAH
jgi:TPR repeat protein